MARVQEEARTGTAHTQHTAQLEERERELASGEAKGERERSEKKILRGLIGTLGVRYC